MKPPPSCCSSGHPRPIAAASQRTGAGTGSRLSRRFSSSVQRGTLFSDRSSLRAVAGARSQEAADSPDLRLEDCPAVFHVVVARTCPLCLEARRHPSLSDCSGRSVRSSVCTNTDLSSSAGCPACNRPLRWDRQDVSCCACGVLLCDADPVPVSSYGVDLAETVTSDAARESLSLHPKCHRRPAFWWAGRLAAAVAKTPAWLADVAERLDLRAST